MGLAVEIGFLASLNEEDPEGAEGLREQFALVNCLLAKHGLPLHHEPAELPELSSRADLAGFPYSWIHYLRRAVAYARQAPNKFAPVPDGEDPSEDALVDEELTCSMNSHFICHSDCEGMYVPIDFSDLIFDDDLPGGMLGSSQRALAELVQAAPLIDIPLRPDGSLADSVAEQIAGEGDSDAEGTHPYEIERRVWLTMYEAFRLSVAHGAAVVYC